MASYQIPERFKKGFGLISKLSQLEFAPILNLISQALPGEGVKQLVEKSKKEGLKIERDDLEDILRTLFSVYTLVNQGKNDNKEVIQGLKNAYKTLSDENELDEKQIENLGKNIEAALDGQESVKITLKAYNLLGENEKIFDECRIITDIRPIFSQEISDGSKSAVIFHKLRIDYAEDSKQKRMFFALDLNDLNDLKKLIERAIDKEESIRNEDFMKGISFLELKK